MGMSLSKIDFIRILFAVGMGLFFFAGSWMLFGVGVELNGSGRKRVERNDE